MLQPKKTKFRKMHKGRISGNAKGGFALNFGSYGLKSLEPSRVTARQIEAARRAMTRHMKRASLSLSVKSELVQATFARLPGTNSICIRYFML